MHGPVSKVLAMTNSIKTACLLSIGISFMSPSLALAQIATKIELKSDDRFRGRSLSNTSPVAKIDLALDIKGGSYLGGSVTANVGSLQNLTLQGVTGYFGHAIPLDDNITIDVGVAGYSYTDAFSGQTATGYGELYLGLNSGRVAAYAHYTPDYFGNGISVLYTKLSYSRLLDNDFTLKAHGGVLMQTSGIPRLGGRSARYDARIAFSRDVLGLEAEIGLTVGGPDDRYFAGPWGGSSALVFSLAKHF